MRCTWTIELRTVECRYNAVQHNMILHTTVATDVECKSEFQHPKDTPTDELWDVVCENFGEYTTAPHCIMQIEYI